MTFKSFCGSMSILIVAVIAGILCGFISGRYIVHTHDQQARQELQLQVESAQDREYIRVVSAVADAYGYDPSEVEVDAGLVDEDGNIKR